MGDIRDMAAFAWNGHCVYGDNDSIKAVRAAIMEAEKVPALRARLGGRPDWGDVYGNSARSASVSDNDLVIVTRETARLAGSAIDAQQAQDAYHNFSAARREIDAALANAQNGERGE